MGGAGTLLNALRLLRFVDAVDERSVQPTEGALTHRPRNAQREN